MYAKILQRMPSCKFHLKLFSESERLEATSGTETH